MDVHFDQFAEEMWSRARPVEYAGSADYKDQLRQIALSRGAGVHVIGSARVSVRASRIPASATGSAWRDVLNVHVRDVDAAPGRLTAD